MRGMMAILFLIAAFAGCAGEPDASEAAALPNQPWAGTVQTAAFNPIAGAFVTVTHPATLLDDGTRTEQTTSTTTTDADGTFQLLLPPSAWNFTVTHDEYFPIAGTTAPNGSVALSMEPMNVIVPFQRAYPFDGYIECAAEYLIITPSCDTILTFAGAPPLFEDESVFEVPLDDFWSTAILDVQFSLADHPGIAGLRVSAYAADANAELFNYERIQQTVGEGPFTLRLSPGEDYGDDVPTPEGEGGLRFEFYPHGHGDDTICTPDECFLGVGVTYRLEFQAVATVFYHESAPEGWTLL